MTWELNRRKAPRTRLSTPVVVTRVADGVTMPAKTLDISRTGLALLCTGTLEPSQEILLVLSPGSRIIPARGRVVRTAASSVAGVEFTHVRPGPRRSLRSWIGPSYDSASSAGAY